MKIFLTGADGYLGSLLAERFAEMPEVESITGIGLGTAPCGLPTKANFFQLDMRSPDLARVMAGHDVVVNTACIVLWPARMTAQERDDINLNGARHVAQTALACGIKRFLHTSSIVVYDLAQLDGQRDVMEDFPLGRGDSKFYYWNSKALAERAVTEIFSHADVALTCLRPTYIIGPRNVPVVKSYQRNGVNIRGHNPQRQFIHEEDVAAAFVLALRCELRGAFNITPDDAVRLAEVWPLLGKRYVPTVSLRTARFVTWVRWRFFGAPVHPCWVEDMLVDFTGSNTRLKAQGWTPRYTCAAALRSAAGLNFQNA